MTDDIIKRLRSSKSTGRFPSDIEEEAADRIEADAKRIIELALDAIAAGTQAEEAYQAQLAAEARVKVLKDALLWCSGSDDFSEGGRAREGWLKICAPLIARAALEGEKK